MIDNKNYILVEGNGYANKSEAYDTIRLCYSTLKGVTTYYDNGLWYIVQSKALMWAIIRSNVEEGSTCNPP